MFTVASSIVIYRPPTQVFDFISSSANDFEWQYGTLASSQISEGATRIGAAFRSVGHLMGRRMVSTFEITEYEANRRYGFRSLSGPLDSHTLYTLETGPGSTRIQAVTEAKSQDSFEVSEGIMQKYLHKELRDNLSMLKTILEGRGVLGGPI